MQFGVAGRTTLVAVSLVVQKFGGTSIADVDRIKEVARHIAWTKHQGDEPVVVVSAMGKTTDELIRMAQDVSSGPARPRA